MYKLELLSMTIIIMFNLDGGFMYRCDELVTMFIYVINQLAQRFSSNFFSNARHWVPFSVPGLKRVLIRFKWEHTMEILSLIFSEVNPEQRTGSEPRKI